MFNRNGLYLYIQKDNVEALEKFIKDHPRSIGALLNKLLARELRRLEYMPKEKSHADSR